MLLLDGRTLLIEMERCVVVLERYKPVPDLSCFK